MRGGGAGRIGGDDVHKPTNHKGASFSANHAVNDHASVPRDGDTPVGHRVIAIEHVSFGLGECDVDHAIAVVVHANGDRLPLRVHRRPAHREHEIPIAGGTFEVSRQAVRVKEIELFVIRVHRRADPRWLVHFLRKIDNGPSIGRASMEILNVVHVVQATKVDVVGAGAVWKVGGRGHKVGRPRVFEDGGAVVRFWARLHHIVARGGHKIVDAARQRNKEQKQHEGQCRCSHGCSCSRGDMRIPPHQSSRRCLDERWSRLQTHGVERRPRRPHP